MNGILEERPTLARRRGTNPVVNRIVVAIDLSEHSRKTIAYAAALAKHFGASLTLVHAFEPEPFTFTTPQVHESYEMARRDAQLTLLRLVDEVRETYPNCEMEFRIGEPAEQIALMVLNLNADLVITASHSPNFLARLFRAGEAIRILRSVCCPVLVYHEGNE